MKKLLFLVFFTFLSFWQTADAGADTNLVWSTPTFFVDNIFISPDGKYLYGNQNNKSRFIKIDANNGVILDSIVGKGLISGFSPDWKYIYTFYSTFSSIKKLDINKYIEVDSIKNMQDIKDGLILNMKVSNDNRLVLAIGSGKYIFVILDGNNMEIIDKKLKHDISDSLNGPNALAISPNSNYFIAEQNYQAVDSINHKAIFWSKEMVWDLNTLQPIKQINTQTSYWDFKYSPDGKFFAMNSYDNFSLYKTEDYTLIKQMKISHALDFSNDSKFISISISDSIYFFNLSNFIESCSQTADRVLSMKLNSDNSILYFYDAKYGYLRKINSCLSKTGFYDPKLTIPPIIYVNVVSNELIINNYQDKDGIYSYKITNLKGDNLISNNIEINNHQAIIGLPALPTGIFFLTLNNVSHKFIVTR